MTSSTIFALTGRMVLLGFISLWCPSIGSARVVRIAIEKKESPAYKSLSFGKAGQYEILMGHFFGEVDPNDPVNLTINDIKLAPRNPRGMVEYSATFEIAKPIDMTKASGVLLYTVVNRGNGCP